MIGYQLVSVAVLYHKRSNKLCYNIACAIEFCRGRELSGIYPFFYYLAIELLADTAVLTVYDVINTITSQKLYGYQ
jgi:hypothetical protein